MLKQGLVALTWRIDRVGLIRENTASIRRVPLAFQVVVKARMKGGIPVRLDHAAHHVLAP